MAGDSSADQDPDDNSDSDFVESDPTHRYGRYKEVLGKGAFKTVYKAFDELEGIEVAWNQIKLADVLRNVDDMERLSSEVHLLKTLKHKNIIKFYSSWVDIEHDNVNFITEIFTSGNLRQYRKRHKHVDLRALKNWSRQILQGLFYLHSHNPPVIHRDLKCDNIFVNGNQGEVKIGDLGLAAILQKANSAHSVIGTPEFMAPELYEEEYNELVDIYAFGMCLLELVTFEYPYVECANAAQIYKKVTSGIKPASLEKVQDPDVRQFIEKCIADVSARLPASELLEDPFLRIKVYNESVGCSSQRNSRNSALNSDCRSQFDGGGPEPSRDEIHEAGHGFVVEGQRKDVNTIFLKLRIADSTGHVHNIHFPFDIEVDTALSVAGEMVAELDLTDQDVTTIAEMIDSEIQTHIPEWVSRKALEDINGFAGGVSDTCDSEIKDELSPLASDSDPPSGGLVLERLPSGRKYWSDSPKDIRGSPSRPSHSDFSSQFSEPFVESPGWEINGEKGGGAFSRLSEVQDEHEDQLMDSQSNENQDLESLVNQDDFQEESPSSEINGEKDGVILDSKVSEIQNGHKEQLVGSQVFENQDDLQGSHLDDPSFSFGENDVDNDEVDIRVLTNRLDRLLVKQQKELDELRSKHELAIADLVKDLSPETCDRVFNNCHFKVPMYSMWGKSTNSNPAFVQAETSAAPLCKSTVGIKLDNSERPPIENKFTHPKGTTYSPGRSSIFNLIGKFRRQNSLCENRSIFNFMGKFKRQYSFSETGFTRSMFRDGSKPALLKGDPKSASCLGIAVILADDIEKS